MDSRKTGAWRLLAPLVPIAAFWILNARALRSWWMTDDPCLLGAALQRGLLTHFYDPETWRALSGTVLMPWTPFSLGLDHAFFGLEPRFFYAHQLLSFSLLLVLGYLVLRTFAGRLAAAGALTVFAVSAPSFAVASQLMNRHYLEGLVLALAAYLCFRRAVLKDRRLWAVLGAVLYALAMTAKEVFVPLVVLLPLVPLGSWRQRWIQALPFAAAAALYLPWRIYMLGWANILAGYLPSGQSAGPGHVLAMAALDAPWRLAALGFVALAVLIVLRRNRPALILGAAAVVVLVLPLLRLSALMVAPRHFFLPALAAAMLLAAALQGLPRRVAVPVVLVLCGLTLNNLLATPIWRGYDTQRDRYRVEGEVILKQDKGVLLTRLQDTQYLRCLAEIRQDTEIESTGATFCGDGCWCSDQPGLELWRIEDGVLQSATPVTACAEKRPLNVDLRYDRARGRLAWSFGPWNEGRWHVLLVTEHGTSIPVPLVASGEISITLAAGLRTVVRYTSPEGWQTYSPALDPTAGEVWQRP